MCDNHCNNTCEEKEKVGLAMYLNDHNESVFFILISSMAASSITNVDGSPTRHRSNEGDQYVPAATACRPLEEIKLSDCKAYGTTVMEQQLAETPATG